MNDYNYNALAWMGSIVDANTATKMAKSEMSFASHLSMVVSIGSFVTSSTTSMTTAVNEINI